MRIKIIILILLLAFDARAEFFVTAGVDNQNPFTGQQINYTFTILDTQNIQIEEPLFIDDKNWVVRKLKHPSVSIITVNGLKTREIKFYYALFAQKSGVIKTPEIRINAFYTASKPAKNSNGYRFNFEDFFERSITVVLTAPQIDISVMPTNYPPSQNAEIKAVFEPKNPEFKIGEAVNREISLEISGILEAQLPDIILPEIEGIKQYPSKPVTEMLIRGDKIIAIKKISNVYIPTKPGEFTLPEIAVEWFDINTKELKKTALPMIKITVEGNYAMGQEPVKENDKAPYLFIILVFAAGVMILPAVRRTKTNYQKEAVNALKTGNYKEARDNIIIWAKEFYQNERIFSLKDAGKASNNIEFAERLNELEIFLYAPKKAEFDRDRFISVFKKVSRKKVDRKDAAPLPGLYK